jgi:hypothetical protein
MDKVQDLKFVMLSGEKTRLIDFSQSSLWSAKDLPFTGPMTVLTIV